MIDMRRVSEPQFGDPWRIVGGPRDGVHGQALNAKRTFQEWLRRDDKDGEIHVYVVRHHERTSFGKRPALIAIHIGTQERHGGGIKFDGELQELLWAIDCERVSHDLNKCSLEGLIETERVTRDMERRGCPADEIRSATREIDYEPAAKRPCYACRLEVDGHCKG